MDRVGSQKGHSNRHDASRRGVETIPVTRSPQGTRCQDNWRKLHCPSFPRVLQASLGRLYVRQMPSRKVEVDVPAYVHHPTESSLRRAIEALSGGTGSAWAIQGDA